MIQSGTGALCLLRVPALGITGTANELAVAAVASHELPGPAIRTRRGLLVVADRKVTAPPERSVGADPLGERPLTTLRAIAHGLAIAALHVYVGVIDAYAAHQIRGIC